MKFSHVPVMHRIVNGEIDPESFESSIDDEVSRWHDAIINPSWTLHAWLGMMWSEYTRWVGSPDQIHVIAMERLDSIAKAEPLPRKAKASPPINTTCVGFGPDVYQTPVAWGSTRDPSDDDHLHVIVAGIRERRDSWKHHCGRYHAFIMDVSNDLSTSRCGKHVDPHPGESKAMGSSGCRSCFETTNAPWYAPRLGENVWLSDDDTICPGLDPSKTKAQPSQTDGASETP